MTTTAPLKEAVPIAEVIGSYVRLQKQGRDLVGLCPFHQEKTGSFHVHPEGWYKCFGCDAKGDVITFVQEFEGIRFPEAVRLLSDRYGIPIDEWDAAKRRRWAQVKPQAEALAKVIGFWWHAYSRRLEQRRQHWIALAGELWPSSASRVCVAFRKAIDATLASKPHEIAALYSAALQHDRARVEALVKEGRADIEHAELVTAVIVKMLGARREAA